MEYPDNRAKFKHESAANFANKITTAKRGAPPRDVFRKSEASEPQPVIVEAPPPPWNAVPDAKDFEI